MNIRLFFWVLALLGTLGASQDLRARSASVKTTKTTAAAAARRSGRPVLVLLVGVGGVDRKREERFVTELRMVLDGIPVHRVDLRNSVFAGQTLSGQIAEVRRLVGQRNAAAVTWIARPTPKLLLLHMVVVSTGRALVRLVETQVGQDSEAKLALVARELLGTAYLFEPPSGGEKTPIGRVVKRVRDRVAPAGPARRKTKRRVWAFLGGAFLQGGAVGFRGPSLWLGGHLSVERRIVAGLHARIGLAASGGPLDSLQGGRALGWGAAPTVGAAYLWRAGGVFLGPALEMRASWTSLRLEVGSGPVQRFSYFRFGVFCGVEVHWPVGKVIALTATGGLRAAPHQETFSRASDGERFMATAYLEWEFRLGVKLRL